MISIAQTFAQHEILLTGGNGFLGKVLLSLLLDRYPGFRHLHVLIRPKRNLTAEERFRREVLESPPLQAVLQEGGAKLVSDKITVWAGDAAQPNVGLDPSQTAAWAGRVGLIVNCAGLVEFFPPVDDSLRANVDAVENVLGLAKEVGAKLLHVSTCYVAGKADGLVEETAPILGFYPHRQGAGDVSFDHLAERSYCREQIRLARSTTSSGSAQEDARSKETARRLIELGRRRAGRWGWVNTYTYTKSLGEQLLAAQGDVDHAIVRPAIVESALRFPFPGWIEGGRTAAPLVLMAMGGMRDWPVRPDIPLEVVPVDLVAAATLAVGALLLEGEHEPVYHLASADRNPFELDALVHLLAAEARRGAANGSSGQRVPFWLEPRRRIRFLSAPHAREHRLRLQKRVDRLQHLLGALRSVIRRIGLPGERSIANWSASLRTLGLQTSFREQTLEQYLPFIQDHRYIFEANNIRQAYSRITAEDRRRLPWDPEQIDWESYWRENQIGGIRKWVQPEAVRDWAFTI